MSSSVAAEPLPAWSIFDGFTAPIRRRTWDDVDALVNAGTAYALERCRRFPDVVAQWKDVLSAYGGDPSQDDWLSFRPLHTEREEDWSDWLQHFLATSRSGELARGLLQRTMLSTTAAYARPKVDREEVCGDHRADLVISWCDGARTHVEVKVGDLALAKTAVTAQQLEHRHGGAWTHYILLPREDVAEWEALGAPSEPTVHVLTWDDVAVALRRALRRPGERADWYVWARGFCGLVEQKLLGHARSDDSAVSITDLARRIQQMAIMEQGLKDD